MRASARTRTDGGSRCSSCSTALGRVKRRRGGSQKSALGNTTDGSESETMHHRAQLQHLPSGASSKSASVNGRLQERESEQDVFEGWEMLKGVNAQWAAAALTCSRARGTASPFCAQEKHVSRTHEQGADTAQRTLSAAISTCGKHHLPDCLFFLGALRMALALSRSM